MDSKYSQDNIGSAIEKLTIESTLSDLTLYNTQVPYKTPGKTISKIFKDDPITPGVILTKDKKIKGIISREFFYEVLAKRFGYAIFIRRPVYKMLETYKYDYMVLPSDMPIREAAQMAFSRSENDVKKPIMVNFPDDQAKLLSSFELLQAQCHMIVLSDRIVTEQKQQMVKKQIEEEQIKKHNEELERRIAQRTKELESVQKDLMEASHRAGMAEVATDVLHNVGNVLNSVNISTNLISEQVENFELSNIKKIVDMLNENKPRLGDFFETDEKGKYILPYLDEVGGELCSQQNEILDKIQCLKKYVDHLKEVISTQQNYAKSTNFQIETSLQEIIEDAVNINSAALTRHNVELIREVENIDNVMIDKQKVLQILVNLINNAKYSASANGCDDKWIKVKLYTSDDNCFCFEVQDNGVGILKENLNKIFQHGFTTKKDGHGFGLHSGALAAKEMGGKLSVESEGIGKGATFKLKLPLKIAIKQN